MPHTSTPKAEQYDPWAPIVGALTLHARGEAVPQELQDAAADAALILTAAALVEAGVTEDAALAAVDRDGLVRLRYDVAEGITITCEWPDGSTTETSQPGGST